MNRDVEEEAKTFADALAKLEDAPAYERTSSNPSKYEWVKKHFESLDVLISEKKYPLNKVAEQLGNTISPQTLGRHYRKVKRERRRQAKLEATSVGQKLSPAVKAAQQAAAKAESSASEIQEITATLEG